MNQIEEKKKREKDPNIIGGSSSISFCTDPLLGISKMADIENVSARMEEKGLVP